jgi:hypothetical protein
MSRAFSIGFSSGEHFRLHANAESGASELGSIQVVRRCFNMVGANAKQPEATREAIGPNMA